MTIAVPCTERRELPLISLEQYKGGFKVIQAVKFAQQKAFRAMRLKSYTVGGKAQGLYKTMANFSW